MKFSLAALLFAGVALAANHTVMVGSGGFNFDPPETTAAVGDIVNFVFSSNIHSATQSSFSNPCTASGGFDSGFPSQASGAIFPVTVKDTSPIWVFCKQVGHCALGMVAAINADDSSANSFSAFKAIAMGGAPPSSASGSGSPTSAAGSPTSAAGSSSSSSASTPSATSGGSAPLYGSGALAKMSAISASLGGLVVATYVIFSAV